MAGLNHYLFLNDLCRKPVSDGILSIKLIVPNIISRLILAWGDKWGKKIFFEIQNETTPPGICVKKVKKMMYNRCG